VEHPRDLAGHTCFAFRNPRGVLLDLWEFERGGEKHSIKIRGWLASAHRNMLFDAAMAGEGVIRGTDLIMLDLIRAGRLEPVLTDWNSLHAPPVSVAYRAKHARTPRVRAVIDFLSDSFRRLASARGEATTAATPRPIWYERGYNRASSSLRR
jgi:LysR family transcriptional regulator for bpeEF and oprC